MNFKDKIYVAGHTGLIGSALVRRLKYMGYRELLLVPHCDLEITNQKEVNDFFRIQRPKYVFLAAGRVGGIIENQKYPADFIRANLAIQLNIIEAACNYKVDKLALFGSSCMYPRDCIQPMSEELLLSGKPESTSIAYAISKLAGVQLCLSLNKQLGRKIFIPIIPNSAYGPNDNFDPNSGHVLSALIRRFHQAKLTNSSQILLWGSGNPRREFIYADDIADAAIHLLTNVTDEIDLPVNVGVGGDMSIKELAKFVAEIIGYKGEIIWDASKPDGAPQKLLDSSRIRKTGWKPKKSFLNGLQETYEWYLQNEKS